MRAQRKRTPSFPSGAYSTLIAAAVRAGSRSAYHEARTPSTLSHTPRRWGRTLEELPGPDVTPMPSRHIVGDLAPAARVRVPAIEPRRTVCWIAVRRGTIYVDEGFELLRQSPKDSCESAEVGSPRIALNEGPLHCLGIYEEEDKSSSHKLGEGQKSYYGGKTFDTDDLRLSRNPLVQNVLFHPL